MSKKDDSAMIYSIAGLNPAFQKDLLTLGYKTSKEHLYHPSHWDPVEAGGDWSVNGVRASREQFRSKTPAAKRQALIESMMWPGESYI